MKWSPVGNQEHNAEANRQEDETRPRERAMSQSQKSSPEAFESIWSSSQLDIDVDLS